MDYGTSPLASIETTVKAIDAGRRLTIEERDFLKFSQRLLEQWSQRIQENCVEKAFGRAQVDRQKDRITQTLSWVQLKRRGVQWDESNEENELQNTRATVDPVCYLCCESHYLTNCKRYKRMLSSDRLQFAIIQSVCINCYRKTHTVERCPYGGRCSRCNEKHHTMLHAGLQRMQ